MMKTLSEQLKTYLDEQKVTSAALAKACGLDRSTIFQYIHGKRPLKNPEHLNQIMSRLALTIPQKEELLKMYQIERMGYELYCRRQKIEQLIRSLPALSETSNVLVQKINTSYSMNVSFRPGMILNSLELSQTVLSLLYIAHQENAPVKILMQPGETSLLNLLLHPTFAHSKMEISHVICLDNSKSSKTIYNIDTFSSLLKYFLLLNQYFPLYFYGDTGERFSPANLFPYLFWTEHGVLQISAREDMAVFHTDPAMIRFFQHSFDEIAKNCQKLGDILKGLDKEILWYSSYINQDSFQGVFELCTGLCSTQFWTRDLIETYISPHLPCVEQLTDMLVSYCQKLLQAKQAGNVTVLMNPANVLDFIQTGRMKEYPDLFFAKPLCRAARKMMIERVLEACCEGWYHIVFLEENAFPLQKHWELCAARDTTTIQYFHQEQFRTLLISESEFAEEIYDYLDALCKSEYAMSEEDSVKLLKQWSHEYLDKS